MCLHTQVAFLLTVETAEAEELTKLAVQLCAVLLFLQISSQMLQFVSAAFSCQNAEFIIHRV